MSKKKFNTNKLKVIGLTLLAINILVDQIFNIQLGKLNILKELLITTGVLMIIISINIEIKQSQKERENGKQEQQETKEEGVE